MPHHQINTCTQLQEFSTKQQQLELQYRPVVQQLPTLLQQLRPEELSQAAEFAAQEGMREPLLQVNQGHRVCLVWWRVSIHVKGLVWCGLRSKE